MKIQQKTVADIVREDYRAADVFKNHGIDFCCGGSKTIEQVCQKHHVDLQQLTDELEQKLSTTDRPEVDYNEWPLDKLCDHIIKVHHRYVEDTIPLLKGYLEKVVLVHGKAHPELNQIKMLFEESAGELTKHMRKEELMLFPFIRKMVKAADKNALVDQPMFGTVENPVSMMMQEHDTEGNRFKQIARLANDYQPPAEACNTYRVTFHKLREFEEDLHLHIHLENNILFPKAIALEKMLRNNQAFQA